MTLEVFHSHFSVGEDLPAKNIKNSKVFSYEGKTRTCKSSIPHYCVNNSRGWIIGRLFEHALRTVNTEKQYY